ncbi:MAG: aconitate hydratase AcnA [Candidatus Dadabacteria bacterium]|nr:aconitate hydratase AcnA [Candidatus Dadabacteria bacterium]
MQDNFNTLTGIEAGGKKYSVYSLSKLAGELGKDMTALPFSIRILLENALRNIDGKTVTAEHVLALADWKGGKSGREIPYKPARVILQDFTGVPCVADLASMRAAVRQIPGADYSRINPVVPVDLVIDHSIQVDHFSGKDSFSKNVEIEYKRNSERYRFLKWAQNSFDNFRVVPPGTGIVHQVNLECLADVVVSSEGVAYPDTLVGTDSHTTMINGLGVLGWGVGGIEAEACMLGQPLYMVMPEVVGFKIKGRAGEGITATDVVLTVTEMLRKKGVVGKFVEFYGDGLDGLALSDRATIANMAPEYGATMGFFPVDSETLRYISATGRGEKTELIEKYSEEQGLFRRAGHEPEYTDTLELDLSAVEPSVAGPDRPQDRVPLANLKQSYEKSLAEKADGGTDEAAVVNMGGSSHEIGDGSVAIAAITSCTNTSNPSVMVAAGLLARKAVEKGLSVRPYVKTSLAPGSRVVTDYLSGAGLLEPLEALGFNLVGYGCTTCIGNSGPLPKEVEEGIRSANLTCAAVLSGNRNFQGRIHPLVKFSYLASPPLVVAFALAGTVDTDILSSPIGRGADGGDVYLKDIWPSQDEIKETVSNVITPEMFKSRYSEVFEGDEMWSALPTPQSPIYEWDEQSTYIQNPPFFDNFLSGGGRPSGCSGARALAVLGDSVTTDHISPAGVIQPDGPAGKYLISKGVDVKDFNSFGSRRGNHEVMMRGTFANIRIRNLMVPQTEGGVTVHAPSGETMPIYDAAMRYMEEETPLLIIAGKEYGTGSSRDWAAKGTALLGVKYVIAESYERIHRSNLVGMGVLPLQFREGENAKTIGLTGFETFSVQAPDGGLAPGAEMEITATGGGEEKRFKAICRLDSPVEVGYYKNSGILQTVLKQMVE